MVVFDERLTLGRLVDLGQAFASVSSDQVIRHVLPVVDAEIGELLVPPKKGEGWQSAFDVFRGSYTFWRKTFPFFLLTQEGWNSRQVEDY